MNRNIKVIEVYSRLKKHIVQQVKSTSSKTLTILTVIVERQIIKKKNPREFQQ